MIYQFQSILSIPFPEEVIPPARNADIVVITRFPNQPIAIVGAARSSGHPRIRRRPGSEYPPGE